MADGMREGETGLPALLHRMRTAQGITLRGLAGQAGVNASTLSRWEAGKSAPNMPELEAVCDALHLGAADRRALLQCLAKPRALRRLRQADDSPSVPPPSGDLLWAMRQRRGWTQAQAARAAGVAQAQVARWERGDSWPSGERLHSLCYALNARPEEAAALTAPGGMAAGLGAACGVPATPDEAAWAAHVNGLLDSPPPDPLLDLTLIATEQRLRQLAPGYSFAARLLPNAYAVHARLHHNARRYPQAVHWAERGMAWMRGGNFAPTGKAIWFGNVVVMATHVSNGPTGGAGFRRAAALLREYLPLARGCSAHYAWGISEMADLVVHLGGDSEALRLSRRSCDLSERISPYELYNRLLDQTRVLMMAGRHGEGLSTLEASVALETRVHSDGTARRLLQAECLLSCGDRRGADERLRSVEPAVRRHNAPRLNERWDRLSAQLN